MKTGLLLLVVPVLFALAASAPYAQEGQDPRFDCVYVLRLLLLSLEDLNHLKKVDETVLPYLLNATPAIPVELIALYNSGISQLHSLGLVITTLYHELELVPRDRIAVMLNTLQEELPGTLSTFTSRLVSCSHDQRLATVYRAKIGYELERMFSSTILQAVEKSISRILLNPGVFVGEIKDEYRPGDSVKLKVVPITTEFEVVVVSWPTLRVLSHLSPEVVDGEVFVHFRIPSLSEARLLGAPLVRIGREYHLKLAIILRENGVIRVALPISVRYELPHLAIECPQKVVVGEPIAIRVSSADYYNATLVVSGKSILNTTITPGVNTYVLEPSVLNNSIGPLTVLLKVFEGERNIGYEYFCGIVVEPPVAVEIVVPDLALTASSSIEAVLLTTGSSYLEHVLLIKAGGYEISTTSSSCIEGCILRIPSGVAPLTSLKIQVVLLTEGNSVILYHREIAVVNVSTILLATLLLILTLPLFSRLEIGLILLPRLARGVGLGKKIAGDRLLAGFTKMKSKVVVLYLKVLKRLKIPLPTPTETLREHFARVVLPPRLRDILWKMLRLAEEDLYSRFKPRYEEALKLFREVKKLEK